jgi:phage tail-like protein
MKREEIERLLPRVFRRTLRPGGPLFALLEVMEAMHEPSEAALRQLDAALDPRRAPDAFVPFLARWLDLDRLFERRPAARGPRAAAPLTTGLGRLRELVAAAARLSQWRGTARGLREFLETATGTPGFEIDEQVSQADGRPRPFHVRIRAPASTAAHRALIERIIEQEKPAAVTFELECGQAGQE